MVVGYLNFSMNERLKKNLIIMFRNNMKIKQICLFTKIRLELIKNTRLKIISIMLDALDRSEFRRKPHDRKKYYTFSADSV